MAGLASASLYRGEETGFEFIEAGRSYAFDADGGLLRLASEAYRIRLAYLFDPYLAVTASQIEALPHQITAVYGEMLPRQPLRFLLADDPGAGKTIMAGLLIKELLIRGDLERCLIVAPGSLVEQWQDEMAEKFGLGFDSVTRDQIEASITGNPFVERNRLIVRLDMAARSDELKAKLGAAPDWDLVICDEAHRMAASYFGGEVKETQRYKLGKLLGTRTRNLLLMSATPHNGKEADFQLFMGLLDADRFEGRFREGVHKADVSDMMRRLTKEELYRFDGTPLFPERRAYTAGYALSPEEATLYQAVTTYVREEMNRADRTGDGKRRTNVGFALQILQRRLASSPAAIHRSLERRRKRLGGAPPRGTAAPRWSLAAGAFVALPSYDPDEIDEAPGEEPRRPKSRFSMRQRRRRPSPNWKPRSRILKDLEERALRLKLSGQDAKWRELESILDDPIMLDAATGLRRKIIIFTEPRDTLDYLAQKIAATDRRTGGGRRHPWRHRSRGAPRSNRSLQQRSGRARHDRQRRGRRGREPAARRAPDGQLRPALEPEPDRAAVRPHPPHRADRGLPPLEPLRHQHARRRGLSPPSGKAGGGARGARRQGL